MDKNCDDIETRWCVFSMGLWGVKPQQVLQLSLFIYLSLILFCDGWLQTASSTVMLPSSVTNLCMHLAKPRQVTDQL